LSVVREVVVIPTGDEIKEGVVLDTNSLAILELILNQWPGCRFIRAVPPPDNCKAIQSEIKRWGRHSGIMFLTGGAGGGKVYNSELTEDCTHKAVIELIPDAETIEIFGSNGHLFAKIVVGKFKEKIIVSLPGPNIEAVAGAKAAIKAIIEGKDYKGIAIRVGQAICKQYPFKSLKNFGSSPKQLFRN